MGNRIYYAIQQVGIRPNSTVDYNVIHGVQSINSIGNFTINPVASLGSLSEYAGGLEDNNEVNLTIKKVIDGWPLIYLLASEQTTHIQDGLNKRCDIALSIFDDTSSSATGIPFNILQSTGLYITSLKYNLDSAANFEEEVGFVGDNRIWKQDAKIVNSLIDQTFEFPGNEVFIDNNDEPANVHIARKQHFDLVNSRLPTNIIGVGLNGVISGSHISSISISASFNRENIPSLGSKEYYYRILSYPVEITTEISAHAVSPIASGDTVSMHPLGIFSDPLETCMLKGNIQTERIYLSIVGLVRGTSLENTLNFNLGSGNKLVSVSQQGGDAGGGIVKINYTYKTSNISDCEIIQHI
jgi:hypothetical protein